ncbi:MAG: CCA tRNA nucleotidyltransferase, partial [Candidatus Paceibacteria bacterium]
MQIPKPVQKIVKTLQDKGFKAYIVGGCVRDLLRNVKPQDWDVATNAKPDQTTVLFPRTFADNKFGTVAVVTNSNDPTLKSIEITPFRIESRYTDKRHPDEVAWVETIEQDLARRDFTVNAMAAALTEPKLKVKSGKLKIEIIDPFDGQKDLQNKLIRAVGKPAERFEEDALRLIRAVRFAITLGQGWQIETETKLAIKEKASLLDYISKERVRDELCKIIMTERAMEGIELLRQLGLLCRIIPELEEGYGVGQNKHHIYDCYEHSLRSLDYAAKKGFNLYVRLAALLHDIAKPRVKQGQGPNSTFYNHEVVGARMVRDILGRL